MARLPFKMKLGIEKMRAAEDQSAQGLNRERASLEGVMQGRAELSFLPERAP